MTDEADRGTVTVEAEISEALLDLIRQEAGEDVDVGEWIAGAAEMRLRYGWMDEKQTLTVDVPDGVAERAELLAEHSRVQHAKTGLEGTPTDWLNDFTDLEYRFPSDDAENGGESEE